MLCLPSLVPAKCVSLQLPEILVRAMSWHAIHDCLRYSLVSIVSAHSVRSDRMIHLIKQCHLLGCRKCAFSVVMLAFRNSIIPELCTAPTLKMFWKSLKTWLFSQGLGRVATKPVNCFFVVVVALFGFSSLLDAYSLFFELLFLLLKYKQIRDICNPLASKIK